MTVVTTVDGEMHVVDETLSVVRNRIGAGNRAITLTVSTYSSPEYVHTETLFVVRNIIMVYEK